MKYFFITLVFLTGVLVGRWSTSESTSSPIENETSAREPKENADEIKTLDKKVGSIATAPEVEDVAPKATLESKFLKTNQATQDIQIRDLFNSLQEARNAENFERENELLSEMVKIDPKHDKVYEAATQDPEPNPYRTHPASTRSETCRAVRVFQSRWQAHERMYRVADAARIAIVSN